MHLFILKYFFECRFVWRLNLLILLIACLQLAIKQYRGQTNLDEKDALLRWDQNVGHKIGQLFAKYNVCKTTHYPKYSLPKLEHGSGSMHWKILSFWSFLFLSKHHGTSNGPGCNPTATRYLSRCKLERYLAMTTIFKLPLINVIFFCQKRHEFYVLRVSMINQLGWECENMSEKKFFVSLAMSMCL